MIYASAKIYGKKALSRENRDRLFQIRRNSKSLNEDIEDSKEELHEIEKKIKKYDLKILQLSEENREIEKQMKNF